VRISSEYHFGPLICEASPNIHRIPARNPHTPRGRPVDAGDLFHHAIEGERIHLQPAESVRGVHPKEARLCQSGEYRLGESAVLFRLIGMRPNQGFNSMHGVEKQI
jgi:hypothetical protein